MAINKLPEFAKDGQKNTDDLNLTDGFPVSKKPARQWFNYLFNMLSLKINEIIESDPVTRSEIVDNLTTNDANKVASAKQVKILNDDKANKTTTLTAGNGLSGGGTLEANRTLTLGTPSKITGSTTNSVTTTSHTHEIDNASTSVAGVVQLNNTLTSTSTTQALTAAQGKVLNDQALGVGQTWQDFTGSRFSDVTYTNNTGKPIMISVIATGRDATVRIYVGSVLVAMQTDIFDSAGNASTGSTIVPAGATYRVISTNKYGVNVTSWVELR